jgi:transcriptional regulator with XRE-family HTH domain
MRIDIHDKPHVALREALREIRLSAGLSQEQLAERLETKQSFISKYERGERNLDFLEVIRVCRACNYDPCELVRRVSVSDGQRSLVERRCF